MKIDLLLRNTSAVTLDAQHPGASTIGVHHGRIVGRDADLDGVTAAKTVDVDGRMVTPGLIDAHCHTVFFGLTLGEVDLSAASEMEDLYAMLAADAASKPKDAWVIGAGFYQERFSGRFPDIRRLDQVSGGRPLCIRHTSGHALIANTETLRRAGVLDQGFADPEGGKVVRDEASQPTGLVEEAAQELVQRLLLPRSIEDMVQALDAGTRQYAAEGLTSFTEAGVGGGWIGHSPVELAAYAAALRHGKLHARAQVMPVLDSLHPLHGHVDDMSGTGEGLGLDLGLASAFGSDMLSLGPVKVFMDGSFLGQTAAMTKPYRGEAATSGYLATDPERLRERVHAAYRAGWSLAIHAIGDLAVDWALDYIEECRRAYGDNPLPNRIEHCGVCRPDQVERIAENRIAVTPQASFVGPLGDQLLDLTSPDRQPYLYRGRSLLDRGVVVAGSSDRPVVDGRPLAGIQAAIDRTTERGRPFNPDEALTPLAALETYTCLAARATGQGHQKGRIKPGYLADLTILDGNLLEAQDVSALTVEATMVDGHWSHLVEAVNDWQS